MAFSDYHACDNCGDAKTFYDSDMDPEWVDGHWRYGYAPGGEGYPAFPGYRVYSLCNACEQTHEIRIVAKSATPPAQDKKEEEE